MPVRIYLGFILFICLLLSPHSLLSFPSPHVCFAPVASGCNLDCKLSKVRGHPFSKCVCVVADTVEYHNNYISRAGVQETANGAVPRKEVCRIRLLISSRIHSSWEGAADLW